MNILVVGSGAREHAIVWKCLASEFVDKIFCCAPENAGIAMIAEIAKCEGKPLKVNDFEGLANFAQKHLGREGVTLVGPEKPLAEGIVDYFKERGLLILGPSKQAALIESSKVFAKNFMTAFGIPTAPYKIFAFAENAKKYVREIQPPYVIKADGLASGKGVVIAKTIEEADQAIDKLMATAAGKLILIEEFLGGWECSFTVLSDGENFLPLLPARDYKLLGIGSEEQSRQMTGGMGGICPHPRMTQELFDEIIAQIIIPIISAMRNVWGHPFIGFLYAGLMITPEGPKVLEFNARLGDPEAQVILPLLETDFVKLCIAAARGRLDEIEDPVLWSDDFTVGVVLASRGYPNEPEIGYRIHGLEEAAKEGVLEFHAGTALNEQGNFITSGGRILSVVGRGETVQKARAMAYRAVEKIRFGSKKYQKQIYREDIALNI